jgi:pyruvate/2-oxoglutarate dehydrogenase complex dihydrolipoamide acyltransferase (E2) component
MSAWHDAGFTFEGDAVFDKSVLLRRHTALEDCTGGVRDRAKPERLLQNDALETVAKIVESSQFDTDVKLYFIHMAAGRAINTDLYERGKSAAKKIQEKKNPSALERKLAAGVTDTGVMDTQDYAREEAGFQTIAEEDKVGMKYQCSVCNKMYKTLLGCQKHGNNKHPPAMNFRAVDMIQQGDAGAVVLAGQGRDASSGRFAPVAAPAAAAPAAAVPATAAPATAAPAAAAPAANRKRRRNNAAPAAGAVAPGFTTPPRPAPRGVNAQMLAYLQSQPADNPRRSPRTAPAAVVSSEPQSPLPVSPAKQNKSRRRRCDVCGGLYKFGLLSDHIKKKKHRDACNVVDSDV